MFLCFVALSRAYQAILYPRRPLYVYIPLLDKVIFIYKHHNILKIIKPPLKTESLFGMRKGYMSMYIWNGQILCVKMIEMYRPCVRLMPL